MYIIIGPMVYVTLAPEPLYSGAPITGTRSRQLINNCATSNRLTYTATQQLLDLIRSHCPEPNLCCPTVH